MSIAMALTTMFGPAAATKLISKLLSRPSGTEKMAAAGVAMQEGLTAVEALKSGFGNDFLKALGAVTGAGKSNFSYEAGIADYIKADTDPPNRPFKVLRDELNINLDRLNFLETKDKKGLKNYFRGMFHIWAQRYKDLAPAPHNDDVKATFELIEKLLDDEQKSFKDLFNLASVTGLGGGGALMVISGVFVATGTGVGVTAAITTFLFGIPWLTVGALVLPGVLLMALAVMRVNDDQAMSTCISLAYKLIERNIKPDAPQPESIQSTEGEQ